MDKFCLGSGLALSSKELHGFGLCNGHLDTLMYLKGFWLANTGNDLKKHVELLLDEPGSYLVVNIGVHDQYNANKIIMQYLKPSFEVLSGHNWPKVSILFCDFK